MRTVRLRHSSLRTFASQSITTALLLFLACGSGLAGQAYEDRFVWLFGWGLGSDADLTEISKVVNQASEHGLNGAVVSFGLDSLCKQSDDYFRRLETVRQGCEKAHIELIPSVFSVGYGGGALAHDRNLAEGLPVRDANFVVRGQEATFLPSPVSLTNGGFETFKGQRMLGYDFHDEPGKISFVDDQVKHSGNTSLRLENFSSDPHGHGRVMQKVRVQPHRSYRLSLWVRTEALQPANAFRVEVLSPEGREVAPREFHVPSTTDWRKLSMVFNSLERDSLLIYAGLWGGKSGKVWLDDWSLEEVGPINVLRRPGTPVSVKSEDGSQTYEEGKDYSPLTNPALQPWREDGSPVALKLPSSSRIKDGQQLRVSWFHSMIINDSQVEVCMAEPALYEIYDHEAKLLAERLHPKKVLLNMDEVRMGGTCEACRGRDMAKLLGECITRQQELLKKYIPGVQVYVWSDMLDPNHNAHGNYYLVQGDYTGSWNHIPKEMGIMTWYYQRRALSR